MGTSPLTILSKLATLKYLSIIILSLERIVSVKGCSSIDSIITGQHAVYNKLEEGERIFPSQRNRWEPFYQRWCPDGRWFLPKSKGQSINAPVLDLTDP
jgi:uncharacterized protein YceK